MPKLSPLQKATNNYVSSISSLTGLSQDNIKLVLNGFRLAILHDLYIQGIENNKEGKLASGWGKLEVPYLGTVWLKPINRKKVNDGSVDGYTFKTQCRLSNNFINEAKESYYNHHDYLRDSIINGFSKNLVEEYKSLI